MIQSVNYLVDGTIATDGHYEFATLPRGVSRQFTGMSWRFREVVFELKSYIPQLVGNLRPSSGRLACPGRRVHN
jgi:hypothetical protein